MTASRPGWAVAGDFGSGVNPGSGRGHHVGARVAGALGPVAVTLGGGVWDAASGTSAQLGGTVAVRVAGHAASALTALAVAGAGRAQAGPSDTSATYWTFPVGLALVRTWGGDGDAAGSRALAPWLFPRVQVDRVAFSGARATQFGVGLSAGMSADLTGRLGVHGALDWLHQFPWAGSVITLQGGDRVTVGIGAYWRVSAAP